MQVFLPYKDILDVAMCLDKLRLNKQIVECGQILDAIQGKTTWSNHPCVLQYKEHVAFLKFYKMCLENYKNNQVMTARLASEAATSFLPPFVNDAFCINMRKRLYTKDPIYYACFKEYGKTNDNWYYIDGKKRIYREGKRIS